MSDSILVTIKKMLGIAPEYQHFDPDIIMHINTVINILYQLGVGPRAGFILTGEEQTWYSYIQDDPLLSLVKSYIGLKVRLLFDPPTNGSVEKSVKETIAELEWRIVATVTSDEMED